MTAYDATGDADGAIDPSYGHLVAKLKIWGEKDEDGYIKKTYFKNLDIEKCQRE